MVSYSKTKNGKISTICLKLCSIVLKFLAYITISHEILCLASWLTRHRGGLFSSWADIFLPLAQLIILTFSAGKSSGPCPSSDTWFFKADTKKWQYLESCSSARVSSAVAVLPNSTSKSAVAVLFGGKLTGKQIITVRRLLIYVKCCHKCFALRRKNVNFAQQFCPGF